MASNQYAAVDGLSGTKMVFEQETNNYVAVKVFDSANSMLFVLRITDAEWTALKAALAGAGTTYTPAGELLPAGNLHSVYTA